MPSNADFTASVAYFEGMQVPFVICELSRPKASLVAPDFLL